MPGQTPHLRRGAQVDPKRLFYSDQNIALTKQVTIPPGYGFLPAGTVMGKISESTNRAGQFVPYAVQAPTAGLAFLGGAYLTQDGAASAECHVTMEDSYAFAVGDHLGAVDSDATPIDLGAVVSIDRTTYSHKAVITATNDVTAAITVAAGGMIFIQTDASTPFSTAAGILLTGVDTGYGEMADGGQGVVVLSNAILYKGLIPNLDAGGLADLTWATEDGQFLILR
jgi:hypothetical protein